MNGTTYCICNCTTLHVCYLVSSYDIVEMACLDLVCSHLFAVSAVFSRVAGSYDLMNDAMSVGLHRLWKDWFVQLLAPPPGSRVLDVAGGTGDIALRLVEYSSQVGGEEGVEVTVVDASSEMLQEGIGKPGSDREKIVANIACGSLIVWSRFHKVKLIQLSTGISWVHGDALALPFPNNSFDAYTIAFGMRNVPNYMQVK